MEEKFDLSLLSAFLFLIIWAYLSWRQLKNYQAALKQVYSKNTLLGAGRYRAWLNPWRSSILILALNKDSHKITGCRKSAGIKAPFEAVKIYNNYSLDELRELAIFESSSKHPKQRFWFDYLCQKGVLLQAVEALDCRLQKQKTDVINQKRLKKIEASIARGALTDNTILDDEYKE